tara:strand:+ start:351 stop:506 length:156 start_codon:yes stop_codon:yes gene_type:complete
MKGKWGLWRASDGWMDLFGEYILFDYKSQADEGAGQGGWKVRQYITEEKPQ